MAKENEKGNNKTWCADQRWREVVAGGTTVSVYLYVVSILEKSVVVVVVFFFVIPVGRCERMYFKEFARKMAIYFECHRSTRIELSNFEPKQKISK